MIKKSFVVCGISNKLDGTQNTLIRCSKELRNLSLCYGRASKPTTENTSDSDDPFADLDSGEESDATASSSEDDCLMGEIITDDLETYNAIEI